MAHRVSVEHPEVSQHVESRLDDMYSTVTATRQYTVLRRINDDSDVR